MSSAKECKDCISKNGLEPERCDQCNPVMTNTKSLPSVDGCGGICCSCIERHNGEIKNLPCQKK